MDAFDAVKTIRFGASKTGSIQRRRQSSSPKGVFSVSQYLDNQSAVYNPDEAAWHEDEVHSAVQLELPVNQEGPAQLTLPVVSIEQNVLLNERLKPAEIHPPGQDKDSSPEKCWTKPHLKPIRENAYRILGLPGDAKFPAIQSRADELKLQAKLGKPFKTDWDLDWIWPVDRTEATIQEALWRLSDPVMRIKEKLFWFTGTHTGAVSPYKETAEWAEEFVLGAFIDTKLGHDVAIYMLLKTSAVELEACLSSWQAALTLWHVVTAEDGFWDNLNAQEAQGEFVRPATEADVDQLRVSCLLYVTEGLVSQAQQALLDKDDTTVKKILAMLNEADLAGCINEQIKTAIFGFTKTEMESLYDEVLAEHYRQDAMQKLKTELLPLYDRLSKILRTEMELLHQMQETVLQCFYRILTLWTWSGNEPDFNYLGREARRIAPSNSLVYPRIELLVKGYRNE